MPIVVVATPAGAARTLVHTRASDRACLRASVCKDAQPEEETTMNTWRTFASTLRGLGAALLHGDHRDDGAHPPDLYRRTLLYDRYLR